MPAKLKQLFLMAACSAIGLCLVGIASVSAQVPCTDKVCLWFPIVIHAEYTTYIGMNCNTVTMVAFDGPHSLDTPRDCFVANDCDFCVSIINFAPGGDQQDSRLRVHPELSESGLTQAAPRDSTPQKGVTVLKQLNVSCYPHPESIAKIKARVYLVLVEPKVVDEVAWGTQPSQIYAVGYRHDDPGEVDVNLQPEQTVVSGTSRAIQLDLGGIHAQVVLRNPQPGSRENVVAPSTDPQPAADPQ